MPPFVHEGSEHANGPDFTNWRLGATPLESGETRFVVWAPLHSRIDLHLITPTDRIVPMRRLADGCHLALIADAGPGTRYVFRLPTGIERPDPASRFQPVGVHGPSEVVSPRHPWTDQHWTGLSLRDYVIYELHVGTFSRDGTFDGIIPHLDRLKALGITAIELMPIAQFPGTRNWGYDGVYPFAVQNSYGGPSGLRRLVDACHAKQLAVILDVVHNHLGPEGNYHADFAPYFTQRHHTPWGWAVNLDEADNEGVRRHLYQSAEQWISEFHVDALRLDAVQALVDRSAMPFLEELASRIKRLGQRMGRAVHLIAETDENSPRLVRSPEVGGLGLDAMWCDDLHHALHAVLTGERCHYYSDFGALSQLAKAWQSGVVHDGTWSSFRRKRVGRPFQGVRPEQIVVATQTHDTVGNRPRGDRLATLVDRAAVKLAAAVVLLSPFTPLLFMGEEEGETRPFAYFVDHADPRLCDEVRRGRQREFADFDWRGDWPDPAAPSTFEASRLVPRLTNTDSETSRWYHELIALRRTLPTTPVTAWALEHDGVMIGWRGDPTSTDSACCLFNFSRHPRSVPTPWPRGDWHCVFGRAEPRHDSPVANSIVLPPMTASVWRRQGVRMGEDGLAMLPP